MGKRNRMKLNNMKTEKPEEVMEEEVKMEEVKEEMQMEETVAEETPLTMGMIPEAIHTSVHESTVEDAPVFVKIAFKRLDKTPCEALLTVDMVKRLMDQCNSALETIEN